MGAVSQDQRAPLCLLPSSFMAELELSIPERAGHLGAFVVTQKLVPWLCGATSVEVYSG